MALFQSLATSFPGGVSVPGSGRGWGAAGHTGDSVTLQHFHSQDIPRSGGSHSERIQQQQCDLWEPCNHCENTGKVETGMTRQGQDTAVRGTQGHSAEGWMQQEQP